MLAGVLGAPKEKGRRRARRPSAFPNIRQLGLTGSKAGADPARAKAWAGADPRRADARSADARCRGGGSRQTCSRRSSSEARTYADACRPSSRRADARRDRGGSCEACAGSSRPHARTNAHAGSASPGRRYIRWSTRESIHSPSAQDRCRQGRARDKEPTKLHCWLLTVLRRRLRLYSCRLSPTHSQ